MVNGAMTWRCLVGLMICGSAPVAALAQQGEHPQPPAIRADVARGDLVGVVRDDRGHPLAGAVISAVGSSTMFAVSDSGGRFALRRLAPGPYLLRAHLQGHAPAPARLTQVNAGGHALLDLMLVRVQPSGSPPVLAAGVAVAGISPDVAEGDVVGAPEPDASETAWHLRHARRSVLRNEGPGVDVAAENDDSLIEQSLAAVGRSLGSPARLAAALFADASLTGQIDLLTTTSFDRPQDLFSGAAGAPRSSAVFSLASPGPDGEWQVRGLVTQGDLAAWMLAGSFTRRATATHRYEAGVSLSLQRYVGADSAATAAIRDGGRHAASVHAFDDWRISPRVSLAYGAEYAHFDYLRNPRLVSPQVGVTVAPIARDSLRVHASYSHRERAPGAEEFLPSESGPWFPSERTFSSVNGQFVAQRLDDVTVAAERMWPGDIVIGLRAFRQDISDQGVAIFSEHEIQTPDHYQVGSAGDLAVRGWGVSASRVVAGHLRATLDYTRFDGRQTAMPDDGVALATLADSVLRVAERVHELTATAEGAVPGTDTHVLVVCRMSSGYAGAPGMSALPARFDIQVRQALPFLGFTSARWEMLLAMRTLFRDDPFGGSVYDELFVVRSPKRVLGGVTVRF